MNWYKKAQQEENYDFESSWWLQDGEEAHGGANNIPPELLQAIHNWLNSSLAKKQFLNSGDDDYLSIRWNIEDESYQSASGDGWNEPREEEHWEHSLTPVSGELYYYRESTDSLDSTTISDPGGEVVIAIPIANIPSQIINALEKYVNFDTTEFLNNRHEPDYERDYDL